MKLKINVLEEDVRAERRALTDAQGALDNGLREANAVCRSIDPLHCGELAFSIFAEHIEVLSRGAVVARMSLLHLPALAAWANGIMEALKNAGLTVEEE